MPGFAPLARAPLAAVAQAHQLGARALALEGAAAGHLTIQGDSAHMTDLSGLATLRVVALGVSVAQVEIKLASAGALSTPARANSIAIFGGQAFVDAPSQGAASVSLPVSGASGGLLRICAQARRDTPVEGHSAALAALTGTAVSAFEVTRDLGADVAILSDAARDIPLQGQSAAQIATQASALCDAAALSGLAKAFVASTAHQVSGLDLSAPAAARIGIRSDAGSDLGVVVSTSVSAARQATADDSAGLSGLAITLNWISGAAHRPMPVGGTAQGGLALTAKALASLAVARSTVAVAAIDADFARSMRFAFVSRVNTASSAGADVLLPLSGQASTGLPAHAAVSRTVELIGTTTAIGELAAVGRTELSLTGVARALASIGANSHGVVSSAALGAGATALASSTARSLRLEGRSTGHIPLVAGVANSRVGFGLGGALRVDAHAGATGAVSLTSVIHGLAVSSGATTGHVVVTRFGASDVIIASQAARGILIAGHASMRIASTGAATALLLIGPSLQAHTSLGAGLEQVTFAMRGGSAALNLVTGAAIPDIWLPACSAQGYRAPPALRRFASPGIGLSGRLVPSNSSHVPKGSPTC